MTWVLKAKAVLRSERLSEDQTREVLKCLAEAITALASEPPSGGAQEVRYL